MGKLEKALLSSSQPLGEFGLSSEASSAARIYRTGVQETKDPQSRERMNKVFEREVDADLLARVRKAAREANPKESVL